jgi:hypothetical protein
MLQAQPSSLLCTFHFTNIPKHFLFSGRFIKQVSIYYFGEMFMDFFWNKPVLSFYRERTPREKEPFAVVKALKMEVTKSEKEGYQGTINSFFPLMGNLDCLSSVEGKQDQYVICWFDDKVEELNESFRRLAGVTFSSDVPYVVDERGKRTYSSKFKAKYGKLE